MLVLSDTDGFRIDFGQFRKGILYSVRDADGAPDGDIQIRIFVLGEFGCGIDGCSGLGGDHVFGVQFIFFDEIMHHFL